jgi:glycosyltransferase involved in cell wall biosynthesis
MANVFAVMIPQMVSNTAFSRSTTDKPAKIHTRKDIELNMKMRYALITSQAFSLSNFRGPLISVLVAKGIEVLAIAPDYDESTRASVRAFGAVPIDCSFSRTGINPIHDGLNTLRLALLLRHLRPDVTLCYFIKPVIFGTVAAWLASVPRRVAMIEGLGYVFTDSGKRQPLLRKLLRSLVSTLYRFALARAHKIIFLNSDDINEFVSAGLVQEAKVIKLGGIGVDLADWPLTKPFNQPITFLLVARLLREKGILEYVEAARLVKSHYPEVRFVLLGGLDTNPGSLGQSEVQAWVTEGLLEWPGHVAVKPWLVQASVFVLPSYREGVPRSTQEAMAMGRAVITTNAPGCRETVDEGVNGILVPVRDVPALANAMLRFVETPALIATLGLESRRLAEERFDVCKINARLLTILGAS